jgi:foldase protein PrsA
MNIKKITKFVVAPALLTVALVGCSEKDRVVGSVDSIKITESQLNQALQAQYGTEILEQLMSNELVRLEAKANKIEITDEQLQAEFDLYAAYYGGEEKLLASLETYNSSKEEILNDLEVYLLTVQLMEKEMTITEEDLQTHYEETKTSYLSDEDEQLPYDKVKEDVRQAYIAAQVDKNYETWIDEKFAAHDVRSYLFPKEGTEK